MIYNVVANAIGITLPGLLTNEGQVGVDMATLALGALLLTAATQAVRTLSLVSSSADPGRHAQLTARRNDLSRFRGRNQLVGMCAMAVMTGVGLSMGVADGSPASPQVPRSHAGGPHGVRGLARGFDALHDHNRCRTDA